MADHNVGWGWDTCADDGCVGVRLPTGGKCWAHAADSDLDPALKRLGEHGRLDARGVPITQKLLRRLLAAAPRDDHGHAILTDARFDQATFQGTAGFRRATFQGDAWFLGTTFQGDAWFDQATFQGGAWFNWATFQGDVWFVGVTFQAGAWFDQATFQRAARFGWATFQGTAGFRRATFQRAARFDWATFRQVRRLGPMLVRKGLWLGQAVFHERAQIEVAAAAVCCQHARFLAGVQLRVRWAQVVLDDADLAAPSILAGAPAFPDLTEGRWARALERLQRAGISRARAGRPRLLSVCRADVAGLTVAGVDLRACRFAGAHHLDQLLVW